MDLTSRPGGVKLVGEKAATTWESCQRGESKKVKGGCKEVANIEDLSANGHEFQEAQGFGDWSGETEAKEGSAELLRAGVMGNAWEAEVTDVTRSTGHIGLSPDDLQGRLLWWDGACWRRGRCRGRERFCEKHTELWAPLYPSFLLEWVVAYLTYRSAFSEVGVHGGVNGRRPCAGWCLLCLWMHTKSGRFQ